MRASFTYSVIRYVGDPVRGEGANIGVIVVSPDGDVRVKTDPSVTSRLKRLWPHFNSRAVKTFVRDVEHRVGAVHQMRLEEGAPQWDRRPEEVLAQLSDVAVNEVHISEPALYRASDLAEATESLYRRLVWIPRRPATKGRYLTRASLREMIQGVLAEWAVGRGLTIEGHTQVKGVLAPHEVDVVGRRDGEPDLIMLALPLRAQEATLIRDSLPAAVQDFRASLPETKFLAVLPDTEGHFDRTPSNLDSDMTKRFLSSSVKGLDVLPISTLSAFLQDHYSGAATSSVEEPSPSPQPTR